MNTTEQEKKDLIVLVADGQQRQTVATLLTKRQPSLGIWRVPVDINSDILSHPRHDPGVFHEAGDFLSVFAQQYEHALVLIDAEGTGSPAGAEEIEEKIQGDLNRNGWEGRSAVVVIDPELEIWVWSTSPLVSGIVGMDRRRIKGMGYRRGYWQEGETKPSRPKELLEEVLHSTGKPHSSALFVQLAKQVGLSRCRDDSFRRFREVLQGWFPA